MLDNHVQQNHEKSKDHICETCGKVYNTQRSMLDHIKRSHVDQYESKCTFPGCTKIFKNEGLMKMHLRRTHKELERKFACGFCPMKFKSTTMQRYHENAIHLNIKNYKCDQCDFKAARPQHLKTHVEAMHLGIMYTCDYDNCGKSFNLKRNLDAHKKTVHEKIPIRKNKNNTNGCNLNKQNRSF